MPHDVREMWDREAETFDDAADHGLLDPSVRRAWADLLLPLMGPSRRRVADMGCGTGSLSTLLAVEGRHVVHGIDLSPKMVERARAKAVDVDPRPVFTVGDAAEPPLPAASFDVVLCRHVLWAMPNPAAALQRWLELLTFDGRLVLVEGRWSNGAGLSAEECLDLVRPLRDVAELRMLDAPGFWGGPIDDERYLVLSTR